MKTWLMMTLLFLVMTGRAIAQEHLPAAPASHTAAEKAGEARQHDSADAQPHPVVSGDSSWVGVMIIVILSLFLAAAVIGPIVRVNTPEEVPPAHSHDEPPGTSGHHGGSGTVDTHEPEHGHGHGHGH